MNRGPLLLLGILATLAASFWGLIVGPNKTLGRQQPVTNLLSGALYPAPRSGLAQRGAQVYRSLGCVECHSQQVRGVGSDLARGWGARMTVPQDYLADYPVLLGSRRIGPDLANVGLRQTTAAELLRHLQNPQVAVAGSMMPPYPFLFEKRKLRPGQKPEASALSITEGCQILPTADAEALAAYLVSLRADSPLFEAPVPKGAISSIPGPPPTLTNTGASTSNSPAINTTTNLPAMNPEGTNMSSTNSPGEAR